MSRKREYEFSDGAKLHRGIPAQTVGEELQRINKRDGCLTPKAVVHESEPEEAPLHPCFTWDDERAANLYREGEARRLIRCVVEVLPGPSREPQRVYVNVPRSEESPERRYEPIATVIYRRDAYSEALGQLIAKLRSAMDAVDELERAAKRAGRPTAISDRARERLRAEIARLGAALPAELAPAAE